MNLCSRGVERRYRMSAKKWIVLFLCAALLAVAVCVGLNVAVDPFGVFGDGLLHWDAYNITNNPRVAKIEYLEQHKEDYDSFILGSSSAAPYDPEQLAQYTGGKFYNLFAYGAGLKDSLDNAVYLIDHFQVKNIILNLEMNEASIYGAESDSLNDASHAAVTGENKLAYYTKFAFCNPKYSLEKLSSYRKDTELPQVFDVFLPESGCYDKRIRDVERISGMDSYLAVNGGNFPDAAATSFQYMDDCIDAIRQIKQLCDENDVNLTVIFSPDYYKRIDACEKDALLEFKRHVAQVTDYWDFSNSSVSFDSRYFYDGTHFRNAVCTMMLGRIYGDDSVYVPADFGTYVTGDTAESFLSGYFDAQPAPEADYTAQVPILMYHHISEDAGDGVLTTSQFEEHLTALQAAGYTAISFEELQAFVERGAALPKKPVILTFDDGYQSNLDLAYPILKQHNMKATIFVIGVSIGKDTYKDTGKAMIPHFSLEQAEDAASSGLISIQSHGYDLHQVEGYDGPPVRAGVVQFDGESEADYLAFLQQDFAAMETCLGKTPTVLAYPYGKVTTASEVAAHAAGIKTTLTTIPEINTVIRGLPQSLQQMGRFSAEQYSAEELIAVLSGQIPANS